MTVTQGGALNDPLGLTVLPKGNIVTVNGNDGFEVTTTPSGHQIGKVLLDSSRNPPGAGALFGIAFVSGTGLYYVDDATNTSEPVSVIGTPSVRICRTWRADSITELASPFTFLPLLSPHRPLSRAALRST